MQDQHVPLREHLRGKLLPRGKCLIPGNIYNLGHYPALKLDGFRQSVHGELYEIEDPEPLALLDKYEANDNYDSRLPGFTRRLVQLDFPKRLSWVYEYDGSVQPEQLISSEDWADTNSK